MIRPLPLLAPVLVLMAGCARDESGYPSLAQRPIESRGFAEPETPVAVAPPDPALDARIAGLAQRLDEAASGFDADVKAAGAKAARGRGASVGSDAWLAAQEALAGLDARRTQASGLVGEIDDLASARAAALQPAYPALDALRARAQAEVDRETAAAAQLQDGPTPR